MLPAFVFPPHVLGDSVKRSSLADWVSGMYGSGGADGFVDFQYTFPNEYFHSARVNDSALPRIKHTLKAQV